MRRVRLQGYNNQERKELEHILVLVMGHICDKASDFNARAVADNHSGQFNGHRTCAYWMRRVGSIKVVSPNN